MVPKVAVKLKVPPAKHQHDNASKPRRFSGERDSPGDAPEHHAEIPPLERSRWKPHQITRPLDSMVMRPRLRMLWTHGSYGIPISSGPNVGAWS